MSNRQVNHLIAEALRRGLIRSVVYGRGKFHLELSGKIFVGLERDTVRLLQVLIESDDRPDPAGGEAAA